MKENTKIIREVIKEYFIELMETNMKENLKGL